ncbi:Hypothetical protein LUCI_0309 [Lucifera butyrica]|uniref:Uncharacterized protein n=1 Tax=Lucifera butyrica TaxID=1351585 RepID=A0A498R4J8_9FIRM|nr:hypothetical protein [Lucifera butyrica]VBB05103.1 Hypothetical protein LUCI_0309 [Lucifera butyrica]
MDQSLNSQISCLNAILKNYMGKSVLITGLKKKYARKMIDYVIFPNYKDSTYYVKLIFEDNITLEYPRVEYIEFIQSFKSKVWITEKGMEEPHWKLVFGEPDAMYISKYNN